MLIIGADAFARRFLQERIPDYQPGPNDPAIAAVKDGQIVAAVVYQNYRGHSIEMAVAGEGNWLTPGNLSGFMWYPFEQLGVRRITCLIHRKNKKSRRFCERLGFKVEGVVREGAADGKDLILYGLLRSEADRLLQHVNKTKWVNYG